MQVPQTESIEISLPPQSLVGGGGGGGVIKIKKYWWRVCNQFIMAFNYIDRKLAPHQEFNPLTSAQEWSAFGIIERIHFWPTEDTNFTSKQLLLILLKIV